MDFATTEGTSRARARRLDRAWSDLDGLSVSTIGWTTSAADGDESAERIREVASYDVNVFDAVPHCRNGAAERAIGAALRPRGDAGADDGAARTRLVRDEMVITSQVGVLPEPVGSFGEHTRLVNDRYVRRGLFSWDELALGVHCLAPALLRHQLGQTLERLGTGVDVLFVAAPDTQRLIASPAMVEGRVLRAFEALETFVSEGLIARYGVADPGSLGLERLVHLAERAAGGKRHHLRAVQLPLSLHRAGEVLRAKQRVGGRSLDAVSAAHTLGLGVLATRALEGGAAEYDMSAAAREALGDVTTDAQIGLQWLRSLPGVTTALVGMRRSTHIADNCRVLSLPRSAPELVDQLAPEEP